MYNIGDMFILDENIIQIVYYNSHSQDYQIRYAFLQGYYCIWLKAKDLDKFVRFDNPKNIAKLQHLQSMVELAQNTLASACKNVIREALNESSS